MRARDTIGGGKQLLLWPDENGLLNLPQSSRAQLNGSRSLLSRPLRPVRGRGRSFIRRLLSFSLSLRSRNFRRVGFYEVSALDILTWLRNAIGAAEFGALGVRRAAAMLAADLDIAEDRALYLLLAASRPGGGVRMDGGILTVDDRVVSVD